MVKVKQNTSTSQATSSNLICNPPKKMLVNMVAYKPTKLPRPIYTIIQKRERVKSQPRILPLPESTNGLLKSRSTQLVYACDFCNYKCLNRNVIRRHVIAHAVNKPYECKLCGYKCSKKASLAMHFRIHGGRKPFTCDTCGWKFLQRSRLVKHLLLHTDTTPLTCNICNLKFSRKNQLLLHLKVHEDTKSTQSSNNNEDKKFPKIFKVETVADEFQDEQAVSSPLEDFHETVLVKKEPDIFEEESFEHETCRRSVYIKIDPLLEDPGEAFEPENEISSDSPADGIPFSCDICTYTSLDELNLSRHLRKHTGLKPFTCDFCDFKCAIERNLTKHLKNHSVDERTRVCEVCDAKFLFKRSYEKHIACHTDKTMFPCKICGLKFSKYSEKEKHLTTHTVQELLTCGMCCLQVSSKSELKKHLVKHESEKFSCDGCGLKFSREYQLRSHARIHSAIIPFECDICHLKFAEEAFLQVHVRNHTGEKPFKCRMCPMNFNREIHLRLHKVVHMTFGFGKQLKCEWCDYKCLLKGELRKHIKTHPCD